ncbi:hypothetical protein M8C21_010516 [Ambrosia artemisiifolia]|uniref:Uncharacterized protein n=1 Tax=Ambrosia artemisiifolia TaxID=4212 RepID=A0AAD5GLI9_AMBAR|nr:hypothetical protein M8C21_010516 [Ambrosia artemisiifolia]
MLAMFSPLLPAPQCADQLVQVRRGCGVHGFCAGFDLVSTVRLCWVVLWSCASRFNLAIGNLRVLFGLALRPY